MNKLPMAADLMTFDQPPPAYDDPFDGPSTSIQADRKDDSQPFDVDKDVSSLRHAFVTKDKDLILQILCHRSQKHRMYIAQNYSATYNRSISRDIESKLSSKPFSLLMRGLSMPVYKFMAEIIHSSVEHSAWISSVIFMMPDDARGNMKRYFKAKYSCEISEYIKFTYKMRELDKTDRFIINQTMGVINSVRDNTDRVQAAQVAEDVQFILRMKDTKADKQIFKDIMYQKNFCHIKLVALEFQKRKRKSLHDFIDWTFSRSRYILKCIVDYALNPAQYFASILEKTMKGSSTNTNELTSVILLRHEVDLIEVKKEFKVLTGQTLRRALKLNTSGFYKYALYELIGEQRSDRPTVRLGSLL